MNIDIDQINQHDSDGRRQGLWRHSYKSGQLSSEGYYVNGQEEGLWRHLDVSGLLAWKGYYVNGKRYGPWKHWQNMGGHVLIDWNGNYVNDIFEGEVVQFKYDWDDMEGEFVNL